VSIISLIECGLKSHLRVVGFETDRSIPFFFFFFLIGPLL